MRILIDIGHPGHVHMFRPFAKEMVRKGNEILLTYRQKEFETALINATGLPNESFGKHFHTKPGKVWGLIKFNVQMYRTLKHFKPHITLSHGSMYAAQMSWLLDIPHISFEDTFNTEQTWLYKPFTKAILTGDYPHPNMGRKEIKYKGYHELLYLHPNQFEFKPSILQKYGLSQEEKYVILRFVSWKATHDAGQKGLELDIKEKAVNAFSQHARVFISSESPLPDNLKKYQLKIKPEDIHHIIAGSSLVYGESATMVSEAAVLGVNGIFLDKIGRYYTKDQENRFGWVRNYSDSKKDQLASINEGVRMLKQKDIQNSQQRKNLLYSEMIDVTRFLVWFVENWPNSFDTSSSYAQNHKLP
jgi:predicted glycosyltransferase